MVAGPTMFAAAPSGGYTPGATLEPDCAPGDSDCSVSLNLQSSYSVDLLSASNLDLTGEETIDGVLTSTSTVLATAQTDASENGVYTTGAAGWTRIVALDSDADLAEWIDRGIEAVVKSGTVYGAKGWHFRIPPNSTATTLNTDGIVIPRYAPNAPRYMSGAMPAWQSVTNVRIASGSEWVDQDTGAVIVAPSDLDINIGAAIGPLGIDTGAEAISTWYYPWILQGTAGVTATWSASSTAPDLSNAAFDGYRLSKSRTGQAWRNDSGSSIVPDVIVKGTKFTSGTFASSQTASLVAKDISAFVPPEAVEVLIGAYAYNSAGASELVAADDVYENQRPIMSIDSGGSNNRGEAWVALTTAQTVKIQHGNVAPTFTAWYVLGWRE